jgi:hypothetical protein
MPPPQILRAPRGNRICLEGLGATLALGCLGISLVPWFGSSTPLPVWGQVLFTLIFVALALLLVLFAAWHLSLHAELDETEITRRSMFGAKSLRVSEIESALFSSVRGVTFLTITPHTRWHWLTFSTYTFSKPQLHQIHDFLAKSSKAIRTSPPPITTNQMINFSLSYLLLIIVVVVSIAVVGVMHRRAAHRQSPAEPNGFPHRMLTLL